MAGGIRSGSGNLGSQMGSYFRRMMGVEDPSDAASSGSPQATIGLAGVNKEMMGQSGLSTSVPDLEAPETPNLDIEHEGMQKYRLMQAVRGLTGNIPLTSYSAKLGQTPGMQMQSSSWDAAEGSALDPWADEKARVENANKMTSFHNQYAMMKSNADNTDNQRAFDLMREESISAGMRGMYKPGGFYDRQMKLQEGSQEIQKQLLQHRLDQDSFRNELAETRKQMTEQMNKFHTQPTGADAEGYGAAATAKESLDSLDKILQDPHSLDLLKGGSAEIDLKSGALKWVGLGGSTYGVNTSPEAQVLRAKIGMAHHYLLMADRRQGTRFGASLLTDALPHIGDNPEIARGILRPFREQSIRVMDAYKNKFPGYDWDTDVNSFRASEPLPQQYTDAVYRTHSSGGDEIDKAIRDNGLDK